MNSQPTPDSYEEDEPECMCMDDECSICNPASHYCGGDGYGIVGTDWDTDDAVNGPYDGEVQKCPCCHGSGQSKDCTFW